MPTIIPPGYAQVVLNYSSSVFDSGGAATILGFGATLGPDPTSYEEFANGVVTQWTTWMAPSTDSIITLDTVTVNGAVAGATVSAGVSGTGSWDSPPPNTTVLTTYRTGLRGPRGRGRSYWPGMVAEAWLDEAGNINPTYQDDILGAVQSFLDAVEGEADPPVNHVILQGSEGASSPITPPPVVNSVTLSGKAATQRRRLRR